MEHLPNFFRQLLKLGVMSYGFDLFTVQFSRASKIRKKESCGVHENFHVCVFSCILE